MVPSLQFPCDLVIALATFVMLASSDCGFPGIPNGADIENLENTKFVENTTVIYKCKDNSEPIFALKGPLLDRMGGEKPTSYYRTCVKGMWSNPLPGCAKHKSDTISIDQIGARGLTTGQTLMSIKPLPARTWVGTHGRYWSVNGGCIRVKANEPQTWTVHFNRSALFSFVEIDVRLSDRRKVLPPILLETSAFRTCHQVYKKFVTRFVQNTFNGFLQPFVTRYFEAQKGSSAYFVQIMGFVCPMNEGHNHLEQEEDFKPYLADQLSITVNSSAEYSELSLCELRAYQPPPLRCGRPEEPYMGSAQIDSLEPMSAFSALASGNDVIRWRAKTTYTCKPGYELVFNGTSGLQEVSVLCSPDSEWSDRVPTCRPKVICPRLEDHNNGTTRTLLKVELKATIFWEDSVASIPGTTAFYKCPLLPVGNRSLQLAGEQVIQCLPSGNWSHPVPTCEEAKKDARDREPVSALVAVITTLGTTLLFGVAIVGFGFLFYFRKLKQRQRRGPGEESSEYQSKDNATSSDGNYYYSSGRESDQDEEVYEEIDDYVKEDKEAIYATIDETLDFDFCSNRCRITSVIYDDIRVEDRSLELTIEGRGSPVAMGQGRRPPPLPGRGTGPQLAPGREPSRT